MRRKILSSARGVTLVELLLALSLIGVVSVLIVGVLVSGMNSYRSVNKQISLHDEANAIMTKFSKEIFTATNVEPVPEDPEDILNFGDSVDIINIKQYGGDKTDPIPLEFTADGKATIDGVSINSSMVKVLDGSGFIVYEKKGTVLIQLEIEDDNGRMFQLEEEVTYVNVE